MKAKHIASALALVMMGASLTGCVSKKKYTELQALHQEMSQNYTTLQGNYQQEKTKAQTVQALLDEARRNNEELKANYAKMANSLDMSLAQNAQGNVNISKLVDQINASNKYIKQLVEAKSKSDSLNPKAATQIKKALNAANFDCDIIRDYKGALRFAIAIRD